MKMRSPSDYQSNENTEYVGTNFNNKWLKTIEQRSFSNGFAWWICMRANPKTVWLSPTIFTDTERL